MDESWPGAVGSALREPRYTNRCRYFWRGGGCKLGAHCDFRHVHPIEPGEADGSQKVINFWTGQVKKLGKKERAARRVISWQHVTREHTLAERARRLHAICTDVQMPSHLWMVGDGDAYCVLEHQPHDGPGAEVATADG